MSEQEDQSAKVIQIARNFRDLCGKDGLLYRVLRKAAVDSLDAKDRTNQGIAVGLKAHLIDKMAARDLRDFNPTHSACLDAKSTSTVGLGHRDESIHEVLDSLCQFSWQDTLDALADDYWETGECFLEVVYGEPGDLTLVTGLFHLESAQTFVEVEEENNNENFHYVVNGETGGAETTVMAKWGDLAQLKERFGANNDGTVDVFRNANDVQGRRRGSIGGNIKNSEIIHIRQSRNRSRWYGFPDYMSAVPSIELMQSMTQEEFDLSLNHGVPEFLLFLLTRNINTESWKKIEQAINANAGAGGRRTAGIHIPGIPDETKVQMEHLTVESASGTSAFSDKSTTLATLITTAHGVPPMLANVLLPGKIGAANEGPNSLLLIQKRKIGPAQRNFSTRFARTLGGGLVKFAQEDGTAKPLTADQFLGKTSEPKPNPMDPQSAMGATDENGQPIFVTPGNGFKTILDGMTLGAADTLSRMKDPLASSTRSPEEGLLGGASDRKNGDPRKTRA